MHILREAAPINSMQCNYSVIVLLPAHLVATRWSYLAHAVNWQEQLISSLLEYAACMSVNLHGAVYGLYS